MRKLLACGVVFAALSLSGSAAAAPRAASFRGVVVGSQHGVLLVTSANGQVHAFRGRAAVGTRVSIAGGRLTMIGHAKRALINGVVIRRRAGSTFLSAAKHVLVVHHAGVATAPGSAVQATVGIDEGVLEEENEHVLGRAAEIEVQAVVSAVATGSVTLTVNGQPLVITLPAGLILPARIVGTQVGLKVEFDEGVATVAPGTAPDEDDQDDDRVVTTPMPTTTPSTAPSVQQDGDHHGGDGHHGSGRD
jgi:hypothetical protein